MKPEPQPVHGTRALSVLELALAAALGQLHDAVTAAALPVVRDLVARVFLAPVS